MADNPFRQNAIELLQSVADIQKDLGELNVAILAQHLALNDLLPEFENRYVEHLVDARTLQRKLEYEHRIRILLERADQMSKS